MEFVEVVDETHLKVRVWERGSGETLACGIGACASAVAAILKKGAAESLFVTLPGGTLHVTYYPVSYTHLDVYKRQVKYALALALSHHAELLILDEPTSGLDPVSRDELLDIFMDLCAEGVTILFSTHITSDLDKCADQIIYIKNGRIIAQNELSAFVAGYRIYAVPKETFRPEMAEHAFGVARSKNGFSVLMKADEPFAIPAEQQEVNLEEIMVHIEKTNL